VISGTLHAAGILQDRMVCFATSQELSSILAPKALAASRALGAAANMPLETALLFSSVAAALGNVGQASYAAANTCLDALAVSCQSVGRVGSSLHIPAVSGAGMGAVTFDREQLKSIGAISLDEFAVCLTFALASMGSAAERMLTPLPHGLFDSVKEQALLEEVRPYHAGGSAAAPTSCSARHAPLAAALARLARAERQQHAEAVVLDAVRELTGAPATLSAETPLMEAGVDSLAATELSSRLRSVTGVSLSPTLIFEYPSSRAVAMHLIEQIAAAEGVVAAAPATVVRMDEGLQLGVLGLVGR
jgi:acyl carrier protein